MGLAKFARPILFKIKFSAEHKGLIFDLNNQSSQAILFYPQS